MISKRLKSLVKYIDKDDNVIDVGCDHALLDIYLVQNNIVDKIVVSDVNKNALLSGINNIKKYNLSDKIDAKLANGLDGINDRINTVIISGMGTSTILKILNSNKLKQINKLIIQSNNDYYELRKNVCILGYKITEESVVYDNKKYYINIVFQKGESNYTEIDYKYGPILRFNEIEYYNNMKEKLLSILESIPLENKDRENIICTINEINTILNQ